LGKVGLSFTLFDKTCALSNQKRTLSFRLPESIANNIQLLTIGTLVTKNLNGTRRAGNNQFKDIVFKVDSITPP
jgi:hypothetical protein